MKHRIRKSPLKRKVDKTEQFLLDLRKAATKALKALHRVPALEEKLAQAKLELRAARAQMDFGVSTDSVPASTNAASDLGDESRVAPETISRREDIAHQKELRGEPVGELLEVQLEFNSEGKLVPKEEGK